VQLTFLLDGSSSASEPILCPAPHAYPPEPRRCLVDGAPNDFLPLAKRISSAFTLENVEEKRGMAGEGKRRGEETRKTQHRLKASSAWKPEGFGAGDEGGIRGREGSLRSLPLARAGVRSRRLHPRDYSDDESRPRGSRGGTHRVISSRAAQERTNKAAALGRASRAVQAEQGGILAAQRARQPSRSHCSAHFSMRRSRRCAVLRAVR